jgi:hypothetical protein
MNGRIPPCMGGWCHIRDWCKRYHQASSMRAAERLCSPILHDYWAPTIGADRALQRIPQEKVHDIVES